jgi:hypothetical protein
VIGQVVLTEPGEESLAAEPRAVPAEPVPGSELAGGQADAGRDRAQACHEMLLRIAGRAPDGLLTRCRDWLAGGQLGDLARAVTYWAVSHDAVVSRADANLLSDLLAEAGADDPGLGQFVVDDDDVYPYYTFGPQVPAGLAGGPGGTPDPPEQAHTPAEHAAVQAVAAEPGVVGLWRAWRFPDDQAPWPPPKRVFVIEVADGDQPALAARVAGGLAAAGETDPQVEVCRSGDELPAYTELAMLSGELLWAAESAARIEVTPVFDDLDAYAGPSFRPDHPVLDEDEADKVAAYLFGGEPLLLTMSLLDDVVDSSQEAGVPMSYRTDGKWIWNEASAYYAEEHQLAPDPGLLEHVRASDYSPPPVTGVGRYRALHALQDSPSDEVLWILGPELDESEAEQ